MRLSCERRFLLEGSLRKTTRHNRKLLVRPIADVLPETIVQFLYPDTTMVVDRKRRRCSSLVRAATGIQE